MTDSPGAVHEDRPHAAEETRIIRAYQDAFEAATQMGAVVGDSAPARNAAVAGTFRREPDLAGLFRRVIDRYRKDGYAVSLRAVVGGAVNLLARAAPSSGADAAEILRRFPRYLSVLDANVLNAATGEKLGVYEVAQLAMSTWVERSGSPMSHGEHREWSAGICAAFGRTSEELDGALGGGV